MMYPQSFLDELVNQSPVTIYTRITILTWEEYPIQTVEGLVVSGSIKVDGNSSVRRTASLSFVPDESLIFLTRLENLLFLNKKVKMEIGIKNNVNSTFEDLIWFPMGVFVISDAKLSSKVGSTTVSLSLQDKMVLLNGSAGGIIPAQTELLYPDIQDYFAKIKDDLHLIGRVHSDELTIKQIMYYVIRFFGKEKAENIILLDLDEDDYQRQVLSAQSEVTDAISDIFQLNGQWIDSVSDIDFSGGECIGYGLKDLIMPEQQLTLNPGDSVTGLLDSFLTVLGNYEYFYDINGHFIFREKRNFKNNQETPFNLLQSSDYFSMSFDDKYYYSFNDLTKINSIEFNPKYMNIKNHYSFWGENNIHYSVFLDQKPQIVLAAKYLYKETVDDVVTYHCTDTETLNDWVLDGVPCDDWREELYRQSVVNGINKYYLTFNSWREIFYIVDGEMQYDQAELVTQNASEWFDIITTMEQFSISNIGMRSVAETSDESSVLFDYFVPEKVLIDETQFFEDLQTNINLDADLTSAEMVRLSNEDWRSNWTVADLLKYSGYWTRAREMGYDLYLAYVENWSKINMGYLANSLFLKIQNSLYQHLSFNSSLNIGGKACFYLEPNNLFYMKDTEHNIVGEFVIQSIGFDLKNSGQMTLQSYENVSQF